MFVQSLWRFLIDESFGTVGPTYWEPEIVPTNVCFAFFELIFWSAILFTCAAVCYGVLVWLNDMRPKR